MTEIFFFVTIIRKETCYIFGKEDDIMNRKFGIIGFGGMGHSHAVQLTRAEGTEVVGAYDINPAKKEKVEKEGFTFIPTLEELLGNEEIEIIVVATPNNFHKELSIAAMRAGKHVICEKPVMMNAAELEEVLAVSKECGKQFSVHQNRRWDKDYRIIKSVLDADTIGEPFYIESRVQGCKGVPGDWRCVKEAGGGMLLDWGVHLIDQLMWHIQSPVTQIYTHMLSVKHPDVDDNFKLLLRFENGLSALVEVDTYTFVPLPRWHISGREGTLQIDNWQCDGKIVKAKTVEFNWEEGIVYTAAGPTKTMAPRPKESVEELPLPTADPNPLDYYYNYIAALDGKEELIVKPEQSLRVMKVIDAVFQSAETGTAISCCI